MVLLSLCDVTFLFSLPRPITCHFVVRLYVSFPPSLCFLFVWFFLPLWVCRRVAFLRCFIGSAIHDFALWARKKIHIVKICPRHARANEERITQVYSRSCVVFVLFVRARLFLCFMGHMRIYSSLVALREGYSCVYVVPHCSWKAFALVDEE